MNQPFFSIVIPDYYRSVSAHRREQCIESLRRSTWTDFEVLMYHDGPIPEELSGVYDNYRKQDQRFKTFATKVRFNDWGHSLRDLGISQANGRYIIHLNADNVLYPNAMQTLVAHASRLPESIRLGDRGLGSEAVHIVNNEVLIYAVRMMGFVNVLGSSLLVRLPGRAEEFSLLLPGWPPAPNRIDAMQMVATRDIWLAMGGWHDKSEASDGVLLSAIAKKYGYSVVPDVLGEHW